MNKELKAKIESFGIEITFLEETQLLTLTVSPSKLHELAKLLKANSDTDFDYMFCQTGIDWLEYMEVVYHLRSTNYEHEIIVKTQINDRENPILDSVYDIWKTADFHERARRRERSPLLGVPRSRIRPQRAEGSVQAVGPGASFLRWIC